jgi:2-keto-3-deoxy-L-rhamnonate aldolase RhmA
MKDFMNVIETRLPELLRGSRRLLGMFVGMPVPGLVEMCGHAGFDFIIPLRSAVAAAREVA